MGRDETRGRNVEIESWEWINTLSTGISCLDGATCLEEDLHSLIIALFVLLIN